MHDNLASNKRGISRRSLSFLVYRFYSNRSVRKSTSNLHIYAPRE